MFKIYEIERQKAISNDLKNAYDSINLKTSKKNAENIIAENVKEEEKLLKILGSVSLFEQFNNGGLFRLNALNKAYSRSMDFLKEYQETKESEYIEAIEAEKRNIEKIAKEIERKQSLLNNSNGLFNFILEETFNNYKNISKQNTTLFIDTENGLATLPITNKKEQSCKKIIIGNDSKGKIGKESGGNNLITDILSDSEDAFSFYNEDKCTLEIKFLFTNKLINCLEIENSKFSKVGGFVLESMMTISLEGKEKIHALDEEIKSKKRFYFLPTEVESVVLKLKQENSYIKDSIKYYEIDIKRIGFYENTYSNQGVLESKALGAKNTRNIITEIEASFLELCEISKKINDEEKTSFKEKIDSFKYKIFLKRKEEALREFAEKQRLEESNVFYSRSKIINCTNSSSIKRYVQQEIEGEVSCYNGICTVPNLKSRGLKYSDFELKYSNGNMLKLNLDSSTRQNINDTNIAKATLEKKKKPLSLIERKDKYLYEVNPEREIFNKQAFKLFEEDSESEINFECLVIDNKEYVGFNKEDINFKYENITDPSIDLLKFGVVKSSIKMEGVSLVEYIDGSKEFKEVYTKEELVPSSEVDGGEFVYFELSNRPEKIDSIKIYKENNEVISNIEKKTLGELETVQEFEYDTFYYLETENILAIKASTNNNHIEGYRVNYEVGSLEKDSLMSYDEIGGGFYFSENIKNSLATRNLSFKRCDLYIKGTGCFKLNEYEKDENNIDVRKSYDNLILSATLRKSKIVCSEYESDEEDISSYIEYCTPVIKLIRNKTT